MYKPGDALAPSHYNTLLATSLAFPAFMFGRIALAHLSNNVLEDVRDVPVLLRRRLVEWQVPALHKGLDCRPLDFALRGQVRLGAHDDNRDFLQSAVEQTISQGACGDKRCVALGNVQRLRLLFCRFAGGGCRPLEA